MLFPSSRRHSALRTAATACPHGSAEFAGGLALASASARGRPAHRAAETTERTDRLWVRSGERWVPPNARTYRRRP